MIWNMLWYEICDKLTCLWYDILWCNMLWYNMWWNVMLKVWNVMLCLLNCVYTAWYEWHEITINDMKYNPDRIMYDMKTEEWETIWYEWWMICEMIWKMIWYVQNASGVVSNDNENGKMLGPHALSVLMHWRIPLLHHEGTDAYIH